MQKILIVATLVFLSGCAAGGQPAQQSTADTKWITPDQSILLAANAAPAGVPGTFSMLVQATGKQNRQVYLNSQPDYRDQRNLTIALTEGAAHELSKRLGADPLVALKGREILVTGSAIRTKIHLIANGRMTDKYYFQTHVNVYDADQVVVRPVPHS